MGSGPNSRARSGVFVGRAFVRMPGRLETERLLLFIHLPGSEDAP